MKKKLLLSSVAALTLFTAYNTASAEFGKYGERLESLKPLPEADKIEKAKTAEEIRLELLNVEARQEAVNALRASKADVKASEEREAQAKTDWEEAQKAYHEAVEALKVAMDTQYDAAEQLQKLEGVRDAEVSRKSYNESQLALKNSRELVAAKKALAEAEELFAGTQGALNAHLAKKPVEGTPVEKVRDYSIQKVKFEGEFEQAKVLKLQATKRVEKVQAEIKELTEAIEKNKVNIESLNKAIAALQPVVATGSHGENLGEVRGVLISTLQATVDTKFADVRNAEEVYMKSTSWKKEAIKDYEEKLAAAKDVYKSQNLEFKLEDVLEADAPARTFVTTFGWNKDADGNWVYLKDSEGTKASGWVNDNGSWYYLDPATKVMKKWWVQVDGTWYYLNGSGVMQTGWLNDNGTWYYLEASGAMKANQWFEVDGKWYHVDASGALSVNTTVDGYNVNENGEWV